MPAEEELMGPGSLLIGLKTSRAHYKRRRRSSPKPRKFKISNVLTDKPGKRNRKMPGRTSSTKEEECRVQQKGTKVLRFKTWENCQTETLRPQSFKDLTGKESHPVYSLFPSITPESGWTEHLRSGNKQQIQSRQTEEIGEEVQDLVDQTKLWTVETWEYLFQMIFFNCPVPPLSRWNNRPTAV